MQILHNWLTSLALNGSKQGYRAIKKVDRGKNDAGPPDSEVVEQIEDATLASSGLYITYICIDVYYCLLGFGVRGSSYIIITTTRIIKYRTIMMDLFVIHHCLEVLTWSCF